MKHPLSTFTALLCMPLLIASCTFSGSVQTASNPTGMAPSGAAASPGTAAKKTPSSVSIIPNSLVISAGNQSQLSATVSYTDGTNDGNVTWSSSDDTIITVDPVSGKASAVKAGVATIVAASTLDPSKTALATVTVKAADSEAALTKITPASATLAVGGTVKLQAQIQMSDGSISPNVVWSSSNQNVAMVSNGLVTGVGVGTTTITATAASDSTKSAAATITVTASN